MMVKPQVLRRRGVVLFWVLVLMVVTTVISFAITADFAASRRVLDRRVELTQANELARVAMMMARSRSKADDNYRGETLNLMTNAEVTVTVDDKTIAVKAVFPKSHRNPVVVRKEVQRSR